MHLDFQLSYLKFGGSTVRLYGITQNPNTLDYMIVMEYIEDGSLGNQLQEIANSKWEKRLEFLEVWNNDDKIKNMFDELDEIRMQKSKDPVKIHKSAIYTSKRLKYSDLPNPVNSVEIPPFCIEENKIFESQQIDCEISDLDFQ
ncbi:4859_t:CDS:2 [Dentiscutata heterogama]|uniref:4859_t:CDS:1 n=1 Tax=Dentiscutata heterogama TaxID=1316150 RepID=A0ACA9MB46_9GLOM|nr:4859_t:CDS:2 [Dentiscutata heterogama]